MAANPRTFEPSSISFAYREALAYLDGKTNRKIANNTFLRITPACYEVSVFLHGYAIISYTEERIALNTWGYNTYTTRARFNWFTPKSVRVYNEDHTLYLSYLGKTHKFKDGMSILPGGKVLD